MNTKKNRFVLVLFQVLHCLWLNACGIESMDDQEVQNDNDAHTECSDVSFAAAKVKTYSLTVIVVGTGDVVLASDPNYGTEWKFNCEPSGTSQQKNCSVTFSHTATRVYLKDAVRGKGAAIKWGAGCATVVGNVCSISVANTGRMTVTFPSLPQTVPSTLYYPQGFGVNVTTTVNGVSQSADCGGTVLDGATLSKVCRLVPGLVYKLSLLKPEGHRVVWNSRYLNCVGSGTAVLTCTAPNSSALTFEAK